MCMTWNQDQWIASTKEGTSENNYAPYSLLGEFYNENGDRALMFADTEGDVTNVYNQRGTDTESFYWRFANGHRPNHQEQITLATKDLEGRGFSPKPTEILAPTDQIVRDADLVLSIG